MRKRNKKILYCVFFLSCLIIATPFASASTILDFNIPGHTHRDPIPADYGDNATETPNIIVDFIAEQAGGSQDNLVIHNGGFGTHSGLSYVAHVPVISTDHDYIKIVLTADAGYNVLLNGFDIGAYNVPVTVNEVLVENGNGDQLLSDPSVQLISGDASKSYGNSFSPWISSELHIVLDISSLGASNDHIIGIDNIDFSQQLVPIPSAFLLFGTGFFGLIGIKRIWNRATT